MVSTCHSHRRRSRSIKILISVNNVHRVQIRLNESEVRNLNLSLRFDFKPKLIPSHCVLRLNPAKLNVQLLKSNRIPRRIGKRAKLKKITKFTQESNNDEETFVDVR